MRIGIDCRLWNETGVGRYIRNLVLNLQKIDQENEYVLFMRSKDVDEFNNPQASSFQFRIVKTDIHWHTIKEQLKLPKILNKENLDLMHFPYFSVPIFYNKPFVVTIHDLIINHFPTGKASTLSGPVYGLKLLAYKFVIAQAARKAKKIIAVSNATKKEVIDQFKIDSSKLNVTYEGVDDRILEIKNQKSKIDGKYFLYVGNAFPHKNLDRLLEAFKILNSNTNLVFVSKNDYFYKRLKKKVDDMKLLEEVIFLQNVNDEELSNLYQNALALIMPSLMEGFGLPALEAMANKCLVLSSDIPALKEICGDAAIYFDPYNVNDMAEKIKEIYSNDSNHYSDEKEKGLRKAKLFSWHKMAKETLKVYEDAIG